MTGIRKNPNEVLDFVFDFTSQLGGDTINTITVTVPTGGGTVGTTSTDGAKQKVTVWLSGGTVSNSPYLATIRVVTDGLRTIERAFKIRIAK